VRGGSGEEGKERKSRAELHGKEILCFHIGE